VSYSPTWFLVAVGVFLMVILVVARCLDRRREGAD
jgi:pilus assembly protein TadC